MKKLRVELSRLRNTGDSSLAAEIESLIEAVEGSEPKDQIPLSRKFLALAAVKIRDGDVDFGHDCIGAAVETYHAEADSSSVEVAPQVEEQFSALEVEASEEAFNFPLPEVNQDQEFKDASPETVTEFANLLVNAGFSNEAKSYLKAYQQLKTETVATEGDEVKVDKKKALEEVRDFFKKQKNLAMVKAADEMLEEMEDSAPAPAESRAAEMLKEADTLDGEAKSAMMKAGYMMRAAEDAEKNGSMEEAAAMKAMAEDMCKGAKDMKAKDVAPPAPVVETEVPAAADDKPILYVDPPSPEEERLLRIAASAAKRGNLAKSKDCLKKADRLEKERVVAALIKQNDIALAMDVLNEMGEEEEKENGGYKADEEAAAEQADEVEQEETEKLEPEAAPEEVSLDDPTKAPEEPAEDEEVPTEEDMAEDMVKEVQSSLKKKDVKKATAAVAKLTDLETKVVAAVKQCRDKGKKELALEGFGVWRSVAKSRLKAEAMLAKAEKEDEVYDQAMEGMEKLEDESMAAEELDKALEGIEDSGDEAVSKELTDDVVMPPGGENGEGEEKEEEGEEEEEEEEKETEAMHYEVLQSLDEVKAMKVNREALAFTYWEDESGVAPFYVIQAAGKPVAEIHLADQDNSEDIRAYFCDEQKYTKALAQSVENTNLYEMLRGVHARFYANAVDQTSYAEKLRKEAVASVSGDRKEKLADLRKDFMDAMILAAKAMNKGVYDDKPNPLKAAFAKVLSSYGIANPAVAVEAAFKDGGEAFFESVMETAAEYLEMPKEAFAHTRKMVDRASNIAHASVSSFADESIGSRLSRTSLPFGATQDAEEAPVVASFRDQSERAKRETLKGRLKLGKKGY